MNDTILRWAGNKNKIAHEIFQKTGIKPEQFNNFYEPFCGALGATLNLLNNGYLQNKQVYLNDKNAEIINLYSNLRTNLRNILNEYALFNNSEADYYTIRNEDKLPSFGSRTPYYKNARTIYLNSLCFNGLYRVNPKNQFNVPYGDPKSKKNIHDITKLQNIQNFAQTIQPFNFSAIDYVSFIQQAKPGDLIYCDPPYVPLDNKDSFDGYLGKFDMNEQCKLRNLLLQKYHEGCHVIISNSYCQRSIDLYQQDFNITDIDVRRSISAKAAGRIMQKEIIAYKLH
jgi:DNA adenine methylase